MRQELIIRSFNLENSIGTITILVEMHCLSLPFRYRIWYEWRSLNFSKLMNTGIINVENIALQMLHMCWISAHAYCHRPVKLTITWGKDSYNILFLINHIPKACLQSPVIKKKINKIHSWCKHIWKLSLETCNLWEVLHLVLYKLSPKTWPTWENPRQWQLLRFSLHKSHYP